MQRIVWISPLRTGLIAAAVCFTLTYPAIGLLWIFKELFAVPGAPNWRVLTLLPILVGLCGFVFSALAALVYNLLARFGLSFVTEVADVPRAEAPAEPLVMQLVPPDDLSAAKFHRF